MIRKNGVASLLVLAAVLILSLASCDPAKKYEKAEEEEIQNYLSSNPSMAFELKPSGLYYLEAVKGTGAVPTISDSAFVRYTGMFLNGNIFYSNVLSGKPFGFIVGEMIPGFAEGVLLMAVGGKSTLLIPSNLGYGSTPYYNIPGYTPLLFDIELVGVKVPSVK